MNCTIRSANRPPPLACWRPACTDNSSPPHGPKRNWPASAAPHRASQSRSPFAVQRPAARGIGCRGFDERFWPSSSTIHEKPTLLPAASNVRAQSRWITVLATHLFLIAKEAVHNAVKHSHAAEIVVSLAARDECSLSRFATTASVPTVIRQHPGVLGFASCLSLGLDGIDSTWNREDLVGRSWSAPSSRRRNTVAKD